MVKARALWPSMCAAALLSSCGAVQVDELTTALRVGSGKFMSGTIADVTPLAGPSVVSVFNSLTTIHPGERDKVLTGTLDSTATAVALGLHGDHGHWIVVAGPPALAAPDLPTFQATLSFSPDLPIGNLDLEVRAVDATGRFGPPILVPLISAALPSPRGALVVSLRWDTESDLDLHVITPDGTEIWTHHINSYRPSLQDTAADASTWRTGGILDFDSNAQCILDGRRAENVVWQSDPPPGRYLVRVDTASLCGASDVRWVVDVAAEGGRKWASQGQSVAGDARFSKGAGSGAQALTFDVPVR